MRHSKESQAPIVGRGIAGLCVWLMLAAKIAGGAGAQAGAAPHAIDVGIIVTSTMADAEAVLKQLIAGADFSVLAKEKSIDATASDGGYMGNLDPNQLRGELRDALRGRAVGQLTGIVQLPSGFAIMKVLPNAPATKDLNTKRIASLVSTGAIRVGACGEQVAGPPHTRAHDGQRAGQCS